MSPNIMPPPNEEIVIGAGSTTTIGGGNVGSPDPTGAELINPDAIGPVTKFELWHNPANPVRFPNVTGVRIPFGNTVLQIVKKVDGTSQWSIVGGSVLSAYTDRSQTWWPANIKTASFNTANNTCGYTRAADPLDRNATWAAVNSSDFISFKIQTSRSA